MNNNFNTNNRTDPFLFSESQIKRLERILFFFLVFTAFFFVINVLTWGFYIAYVSVIPDLHLFTYILPLIAIHMCLFLPALPLPLALYLMKRRVTRLITTESRTTMAQRLVICMLLTFISVLNSVFIVASIIVISIFPLVSDPNYSCEDYWKNNYKHFGYSNPNAYISNCETHSLAKKLTLPLVLLTVIVWLTDILFIIQAFKLRSVLKEISHVPPQAEFLVARINYFELQIEMDYLKNKVNDATNQSTEPRM